MLTEDQTNEAVGQMIVYCRNSMEEYKAGVTDYESVSARGVLRTLGYDGEDLEQVLRHIADGGFDYCLDHHIAMTGHHDARGEFPSRDVCYWGADQLESRLDSLSNVPWKYRS